MRLDGVGVLIGILFFAAFSGLVALWVAADNYSSTKGRIHLTLPSHMKNTPVRIDFEWVEEPITEGTWCMCSEPGCECEGDAK